MVAFPPSPSDFLQEEMLRMLKANRDRNIIFNAYLILLMSSGLLEPGSIYGTPSA